MASRRRTKKLFRKTLIEHIEDGTTLVGYAAASFCDEGFQGLDSGWDFECYDTVDSAMKEAAELEDGDAIVEVRIVAIRPKVNSYVRMEDIKVKKATK